MTAPGITFASFAALGLDAGLTAAGWAKELGYGSYWTAETTGPEAFSTLAAVGAAQPELDLGTGVLALQVRSPMVAAMGAATLQALHPERSILLGVGISSPVVTERWHGVDYGANPVALVREYLEVVRALLDGEVLTHHGQSFTLKKARLGIRLGERSPKLVLGALNPKMLALAGELADGVLLNYLPASAVPWCVEQVRRGESDAGRPSGSCTVYAYVHAGVCDRDAAIESARRDLFSYAVVGAYGAAFERAGFGAEVAAIAACHGRGDREGAIAAVSDAMVDAIDILGDASVVRAAVDDYVRQGVDVPVLMPLPWGPDRMEVIRDTMEAVAR